MLEDWIAHGSLAVLLGGLLAAGVGAPLPEDPIILAAGALAHRSSGLSPLCMLASVYVAAIAADCGLYYLARRFGERLLSKWPMRWLASRGRRARVQALLRRYGSSAIFWGRHLAGVRAVLFVVAGIERVPFRKFLVLDALAALVTIPVVFFLGYFFSAHVDRVAAGLARVEHWLLAAACALLTVGLIVWRRRASELS